MKQEASCLGLHATDSHCLTQQPLRNKPTFVLLVMLLIMLLVTIESAHSMQ